MELPQIDDYRALFLSDTPLLDVRAPIEFNQGAFPGAENLPLINDDEREEIGLRYKNLGQDEAIKLGHKRVQGQVKDIRIDHWERFFNQHPDGVLYCFRGGMRSKITQHWIYQRTGKIFPRIKGGYKAMRRFLIDELEASTKWLSPIMLGGRTGIGKTVLLKKLNQQIDLEGIFHHRGSVFGKHVTPQPSQIDIENNLSIQLLKQKSNGFQHLVFEDEAANIGSRRIPEMLFDQLSQSPLILLEASVDERIDITFNEYITDALAEHQNYFDEQLGFEKWQEQLYTAIDKIQRRLGGLRHQQITQLLTDAINQQKSSGNTDAHKEWIKTLLVDYYDPMYDYQINKKMQRVVFQGPENAIIEFLQQQYQLS